MHLKWEGGLSVKQLQYQTVIWDFDGTLVDTSPGIFRSLRVAFQRLGYPDPSPELLSRFVGPPLFQAFQEHVGMSPQQAEQALLAFRADYEARGVYQSQLYPGLEEILRQLHAAGAKLGVATLKPERMARLLLRQFGLLDLMDACVGSDDQDRGTRTKAQMIQMVLDQVGCKNPQQAVLIGDTRFDLEGAKQAGVPFLAAGYGFGELESLLGPDAPLARTPGELENYLFVNA